MSTDGVVSVDKLSRSDRQVIVARYTAAADRAAMDARNRERLRKQEYDKPTSHAQRAMDGGRRYFELVADEKGWTWLDAIEDMGWDLVSSNAFMSGGDATLTTEGWENRSTYGGAGRHGYTLQSTGQKMMCRYLFRRRM